MSAHNRVHLTNRFVSVQSCQTALECFYVLSPRYYLIMYVFSLVMNYFHHCFCYRNKLILILILINYIDIAAPTIEYCTL